jgi:hypothetical protein
MMVQRQHHKPVFMNNPVQVPVVLLTIFTDVCHSVYWLSTLRRVGRFIICPHWGVSVGLLSVLTEVCQSVYCLSSLRCVGRFIVYLHWCVCRFIVCLHWGVSVGLLSVLTEVCQSGLLSVLTQVCQSVYWLSSLGYIGRFIDYPKRDTLVGLLDVLTELCYGFFFILFR